MVSRGYEARPAPMVTPHPRPKEAKNEPSRGPTRTTGSATHLASAFPYGNKSKLTEGVVDTKVKTTVDDDTDDRGNESTIEAGNTI